MEQTIDKNTKKEGFNFIPAQDIEVQMQPTEQSRLLAKDIKREENVPFRITAGARKSGIIQITFFANAGAGNNTESVSYADLGLKVPPLSLVWFLGTVDKDKVASGGGGLIPGSAFSSGTVTSGAEVYSGAIANYSSSETGLTIKLTSTNVGWPVFITAYFQWAIYYDEPEVAVYGL